MRCSTGCEALHHRPVRQQQVIDRHRRRAFEDDQGDRQPSAGQPLHRRKRTRRLGEDRRCRDRQVRVMVPGPALPGRHGLRRGIFNAGAVVCNGHRTLR